MPTPSDLLLALVMLAAPVGTPENVPLERWPEVRQALQTKAVELELMDARESRYVFAAHDDFQADLDLVRKRYADLKDAPTIRQIEIAFPDRRICNELCKFNREFRKHLEERLPWENDRADLIWQAIRETDTAYRTWDAIRDARCDFYYVSVRRLAAKRALTGTCKEATAETVPNVFEFVPPDYVPKWAFVEK